MDSAALRENLSLAGSCPKKQGRIGGSVQQTGISAYTSETQSEPYQEHEDQSFKVILEPDEDFDWTPSGWHASCPALERLGGSAFGETRESALQNINEVVRVIVQESIEEGKPLPEGPEDSVMAEEVPCIAVTV